MSLPQGAQRSYGFDHGLGRVGFVLNEVAVRQILIRIFRIIRVSFLPLMYVGFTLSQATKALRESRGTALLYFRPLH